MFQLIYISTARRGIEPEVGTILAAARRRNLADRITGLLVFDGVRFLQALEGERELVEGCYARIRRDARHRAPVTLSEREIDRREFGDWTMAWTQVNHINADVPLAAMVDDLVKQVSDANTQALFRSFARIDRKAA